MKNLFPVFAGLFFLFSCSVNKSVLKTLSVGEYFSHHPLSNAVEFVALDLDSQLVSFKSKPIVIEPLKDAKTMEKTLIGSIASEELASSMTRLGYIVIKEKDIAPTGKGSFDFSIEDAKISISGTYFETPKRVSLIFQALEPRSNLILASTSASVLRTEEVDELLKASKKKSLLSFERVPLISHLIF
ncbi:MAG: hypothetical protein NZT61_03530 [Deltaproteobacteria bacterium]|nr:hypothetical protein [Deltaproteobacteria bacterium]MCX7953009.1 hypothetical protein [Deltaproteobacteria bacterium]